MSNNSTSQILADSVLHQANNQEQADLLSGPDSKSSEKNQSQVHAKVEANREPCEPHKRIPFRPLRYKFIKLDYLNAKEPRIKKKMGTRYCISSESNSFSDEPNPVLNKILRRFHGAKVVKDLDFEFPKAQFLFDVISRDIANKLGQFSSLQKLRIHYGRSDGEKNFTKKTYMNIAQGLKRVPHLKDFHMKTEQCQINHDGLKALGKGLERVERLEKVTLEFEANNWDPEKGLQDLSKSLKRLKTVNLSWGRDGGLTNEAIRYLGENMKEYTNVENFCLLLKRCVVGDPTLEYLNNGLKEMKNLKSMKFSFRACDYITNVGAQKFLDGLEKHEKLERVWLNFRQCEQINGESLQNIGERFKNFKALKSLTLKLRGLDKLTDEDLASFTKCIEAKGDLEEILLNFGQCDRITDEGLKVLWEGLRRIVSLKKIGLGLKGCSITEGEIMKMIEDSRKAGIKLTVVTSEPYYGSPPIVYQS